MRVWPTGQTLFLFAFLPSLIMEVKDMMIDVVLGNFMFVRDDDGTFIAAVKDRTVVAEEKWNVTALSEEQAEMVYQYLKQYLDN